MGRTSDWAIEIAEEKHREQKEEWIQRELDNPDADESTDGWYELSRQYDEKCEHWQRHLEDEYEWYHSQDHSDFYISFVQTIADIKKIINSPIDLPVIPTICKMAYIHAVTAMETYLGDSLKSTVLANEIYLANAAKNLKELNERKFKLEDILSESDLVEKTVLEQLCKYLYHDITKVMMIYNATLGFHCSYNLQKLIEITTIRHDLVHRNGIDNAGKQVQVDFSNLKLSISEIEAFIKYLDENLREHHEVSCT